MLWAATTLCFFGFFHSGELTVPSVQAFSADRHICWGDISFNSETDPTLMKVHLKQSKCDQFRKGVDVYIGCTDNPICPVTAVLAYITRRGTTDGPFFRLASNQQPLTKQLFVSKVKQALRQLGLPEHHFAGHSFRIGAATAAARAGIEDSVIRSLGRWNSSAFLTYIRTPKEDLAQYSRSIAQ